MKRKISMMGMAILIAGGVSAQNEHLYMYRNDKQFGNYRLSEITDIKYAGDAGSYSKMYVSTPSGVEAIQMSAIDSCVVRTTAIPDIHVNLTDYPDIDDLFKTGGFNKSTVYAATMRLDGNGMFSELPEQTVEFRGRGNSTWSFAKTPYRFKMKNKTSVCGMKKAKTFALIANYIDPSLMRNAVALWTAGELGLPYTNHCVPVNVYLNDRYKGTYMLTEKIGTGSGSVDIDEDTGMLFELDSNYDEDFKFVYNFKNDNKKKIPVMVKDPDLTEVKPVASERETYFKQWTSDFSAMADAVVTKSSDIGSYIDLGQAARYILVNSLACNQELLHPKSLYIHKASLEEGETYHFGPVWDFDWSFGYDGNTSISYNHVLLERDGDYSGGTFLKNLASNPEFSKVYKEVWDNFYTEIYPRLLEYIDSYAHLIEPSAKRDGLKWPDAAAAGYAYAYSAYDTRKHVGELRTWIRNRVEWCNSHSTLGLY